MTNSAWPNSTAWPFSQSTCVTVPVTVASISFMIFIASMMHTGSPSFTAAPPAGQVITSPMVGTFYRASSPGAKPMVEVGTPVKEGEPVCIIEAMKIMNEIESTVSGTVTQVLCENGQAVEFGQPLFVIE